MAALLLISSLAVVSLMTGSTLVAGQLSSTFYSQTCPNLTSIVGNATRQAIQNEARIGASLVRLHFHDCFVNGCDASILLDAAPSEQTAFPNANSIRGLDLVDNVKTLVENACPGVVSCADILALMARESVVALNGPSWTVDFGRRDSRVANQSGANSNLPPPTFNVSALMSNFQTQGLSTQDLVALSGAHTIGLARCTTFRSRLYGQSSSSDRMDQAFNTSLQSNCPSSGGDDNLSRLDRQTQNTFDNLYFRNLQELKGLLFSDQTLYSGGQSTTRALVDTYALDQGRFFSDFRSAMIKMGRINPLTGSSGEIRASCGRTN